MNLAEKLEKMVPRYLPDQRYFVTEIVAKQAGLKTKISIFLDGDEGIDIDVCAQVSRQIGKELDDTDLLKHPYYWAAFVVSGDVSPISSDHFWESPVMGIMTLGVLLLYIVGRRNFFRRNRNTYNIKINMKR